MKLRILGCGTSSGVPRIGNDWGACDPTEPRNRRTRASALIMAGRQRFLIDTSPDMREQLLAADIDDVDAVWWTHDHADHCHGIDDLRQLYHAKGRPVDGYARPETLAGLQSRFAYAFQGRDGYPPTVTGHTLLDDMQFGEVRLRVVDQPHGNIVSAGFHIEYQGHSIAYSTDFHAMTDAMTELFAGVDIWVVDALRARPHPTHSHLGQTLDYIEQVAPKHAILIHMDQSMDYATVSARLPEGVSMGHDGMEIVLG